MTLSTWISSPVGQAGLSLDALPSDAAGASVSTAAGVAVSFHASAFFDLPGIVNGRVRF